MKRTASKDEDSTDDEDDDTVPGLQKRGRVDSSSDDDSEYN